MKNDLLRWLQETPRRLALVILLLFASFLLIYSNRTKKISQLKQRITQQQALLAWMQNAEHVLNQGNAASPEQPPFINKPVTTLLTESFSHWLPQTKFSQFKHKTHFIFIRLNEVPTQALLNWLSELDSTYHLRPTSVTIVPQDKANTVSAKLLFSHPHEKQHALD